MTSQTRAIEGRGLAEQVECGCVTSPENTDSSPATQPRPKRRNAYRDAAIETLLILRQRFPQAFARLDEKRRRPLKVGIHVDIQTAMPDLDKIALSRALRFYVSDLRYHRAVTEGAPRIDLDGNAAGTVTADQAENSKRSLAGIEAKLARQREYHAARAKPKPAAPAPAKLKRLTLDDLKAAVAQRKSRIGGMTMHTAAVPITSPSSLFDEFVLSHLRRAHVRARLALNNIDAAGIALRDGWIDGEGALGMVAEAGLLDFVTERSS